MPLTRGRAQPLAYRGLMAGPPRSVNTFNRFALLLAGRRLMPVWGVLRHSGRKSGREYSTPLAFVATPGAFFIGLPWGRGTDWVRNVRAAGRCTVRLRGHEYECSQPEFVSKDVVVAAATGPLRAVVMRISFPGGFLRLGHGPARR
jgi:deazaflavin-dependent oxidoreductase (nitroreductase family)